MGLNKKVRIRYRLSNYGLSFNHLQEVGSFKGRASISPKDVKQEDSCWELRWDSLAFGGDLAKALNFGFQFANNLFYRAAYSEMIHVIW